MSIKRLDAYKASVKPYAFLPSSFRVTRDQLRGDGPTRRIEGNALWFGRRAGLRTVTFGSIGAWMVNVPEGEPYQDFLKHHTAGRYGGSWIAVWDGESLTTQARSSINLHAHMVRRLEPVLKNFPDVPEDWDGWFDIREDYR